MQDHPTFYRIGEKLENHEGRLSKLENVLALVLAVGRKLLLAALALAAIALNYVPSVWADLLKQMINAALRN